MFEWQGLPMAWWGVESFMGPLPYFLSHLGEKGLDRTGGLPTSGSRIRPWSLGSRILESLSGRVARGTLETRVSHSRAGESTVFRTEPQGGC